MDTSCLLSYTTSYVVVNKHSDGPLYPRLLAGNLDAVVSGKAVRLDTLAGRVFYAWNCLHRDAFGQPISWRALAAKYKFPSATISKIVREMQAAGRGETTIKLAQALNVSPEWLLTGKGTPPKLTGPITAPRQTTTAIEKLLVDADDETAMTGSKQRSDGPPRVEPEPTGLDPALSSVLGYHANAGRWDECAQSSAITIWQKGGQTRTQTEWERVLDKLQAQIDEFVNERTAALSPHESAASAQDESSNEQDGPSSSAATAGGRGELSKSRSKAGNATTRRAKKKS